jgi:hypothetical protein
MSRELRITLSIMAVVLILAAPVIFARPAAVPGNYSYLSAVFHIVPTPTPTPIPTPTPPDISTLVIQLGQMKSGYVRDDWRAVTNADAAQTYANPKAAEAAFTAQGRETSWYARYTSTDYLFSDALGVSSQVYRYLTIDGATAGREYILAEEIRDNPNFRPFGVSAPCCPVIGVRQTIKSGNLTADNYYIIMQNGRYVAHVEVIGLSGSVSVSRAISYANLALNHIYAVPQVIHVDADLAPAGEPQPGTINAALSLR